MHTYLSSHCNGCGADSDYYYPWELITILANTDGWRILGEVTKYVALSSMRFTRISGPSFCVTSSARAEHVVVTAVDPKGVLREREVVLDLWSHRSGAWVKCDTFEETD